MLKAAVILGSESDREIACACARTLRALSIEFEARVLSAHRTPQQAAAFAETAKANGFGVLIAFAGKAAHLAGALAARTTLPVIGVPVRGSAFLGLDSLLSTVQMPSGIPVATVAVDGAENAALLAAQILALCDDELSKRLTQYRERLTQNASDADARAHSDALSFFKIDSSDMEGK